MLHFFLMPVTIVTLFVASYFAHAEHYDVYLLAGQSNMDGRGDASQLTASQKAVPESAIIYYRNPPFSTDGWKSMGTGFSVPPKFKGDLPSSAFGPEIGFVSFMSDARPGRPIALIKGSRGGTSLRVDWVPGEPGKPETQGPCYRHFVETMRQATSGLVESGHSYRLRGMLWHQGESDSKSTEAVYRERLMGLISRIREDVDVADLPVVVGEVFDNGKRDRVRSAIKAVGTSGPTVGFVSAEGTSTWDEGTHFDAKSQWLLGQRFGKEMRKLIP